MKDITREWLHKSDKDFKVAKKLLKSDDPDSYDLICFLAQQAIEKTMKALLLHHDKAFPKTHNLEDLNRLIIEVLPLWEVLSDDLLVLTRGATEFRYPGEDATQADAERAVQICTILHKKLLSYF